jgi:hypothetical protein
VPSDWSRACASSTGRRSRRLVQTSQFNYNYE